MKNKKKIDSLEKLAQVVDYSFINTLTPDPNANENGQNHNPKEVFNGHYVPVTPTPIEKPIYITHSKTFFEELGFDDTLVQSEDFMKMFSANTAHLTKPLNAIGWATGYALSIYGTEYYQQCPFQTGNAYGDGRAISILEGVFNNQHWEMQLKGAGRTPYCRGADGRAVLRSSIREFLAQEHMHALGVPTSRSLTLYTSTTETVTRPWFSHGSYSYDPDIMIEEKVAISTRVAPSFIRVGQLELFGRRARKEEHTKAKEELAQLVNHAIEREYSQIDTTLPLEEKIVLFAQQFQERLCSLIANWIRVGYCQGNFNSDNTAIGGFTLDYGPFGFMDNFDSQYQPWTGGGVHFSFFNQGSAAKQNFDMFCSALMPLLTEHPQAQKNLINIKNGFANTFQEKMTTMWANKLGLETLDKELFNELMSLMQESFIDYTIFFRELCNLPKDMSELNNAFYKEPTQSLKDQWAQWLEKWKSKCTATSEQLKAINPKYTLREWILVEAYTKANEGDYSLIHELQEVMTHPYDEQSKEIEEKYYTKKSEELFDMAGVSHISCSS